MEKSEQIICKVAFWYYRRMALMFLLFVGGGLWFFYDGLIGWPQKNKIHIAKMAFEAGADIDMRSEELSTDTATTINVLKDLLIRLNFYQICVTLQPTSPLRGAEDITKSLELFNRLDADAVVSVCKVEHPPQWTNTIGGNGEMVDFIREEIHNKCSQDLGDYYRLNGAIYCNSVKRLLNSDSPIFKSNCYAYVMPFNKSVDIDTKDDFELAEYYITKK